MAPLEVFTDCLLIRLSAFVCLRYYRIGYVYNILRLRNYLY